MRASRRASAASLIPVESAGDAQFVAGEAAVDMRTPRPDLHDTLCAVTFAIDFATVAGAMRCPFISRSRGCGDYFHRIFQKRVRAYRIATPLQNDFMVQHIRDAAGVGVTDDARFQRKLTDSRGSRFGVPSAFVPSQR